MMERTSGFQPVYNLPKRVEGVLPALVLVRVQKTVMDREGALIKEYTVYQTSVGSYLGEGRWALSGEQGVMWDLHRSARLVTGDKAGFVLEMREIAAWCGLPEAAEGGAADIRRICDKPAEALVAAG